MSSDDAERVKRGCDAIQKLYDDYREARRVESIRIFGHPGAFVATVPGPTQEDVVRAVLEATR